MKTLQQYPDPSQVKIWLVRIAKHRVTSRNCEIEVLIHNFGIHITTILVPISSYFICESYTTKALAFQIGTHQF